MFLIRIVQDLQYVAFITAWKNVVLRTFRKQIKLNTYTIAVMVIAVLRCSTSYENLFRNPKLPSVRGMFNSFLEFYKVKYRSGTHIVSIIASSPLVEIQPENVADKLDSWYVHKLNIIALYTSHE